MPLPATTRFIHRSDEADLSAIGTLNDTRLAMQETADIIGGNPYGLPVLFEEGVKATVALAIEKGFGF